MKPRVFSACIKDGKQISGVFDLIYHSPKEPALVYDYVAFEGKQIAKSLLINPEWLHAVDNPNYQFVYKGAIKLPTPKNN